MELKLHVGQNGCKGPALVVEGLVHIVALTSIDREAGLLNAGVHLLRRLMLIQRFKRFKAQ